MVFEFDFPFRTTYTLNIPIHSQTITEQMEEMHNNTKETYTFLI